MEGEKQRDRRIARERELVVLSQTVSRTIWVGQRDDHERTGVATASCVRVS